jgi:hypothetical protein
MIKPDENDLLSTHKQYHRAKAIEHKVIDAVQRGRKVWEPASQRAYEEFTTSTPREIVRAEHAMIALEVIVTPLSNVVGRYTFVTSPESLWDLFEVEWVRMRVKHDDVGRGIIWRVLPKVDVREFEECEIWSLYLRVGFVPANAERLLLDGDIDKLHAAWDLEDMGLAS